MSTEVAKVFDFSTGKEIVDIKKTNRKTFHVMKDGTMTSYMYPVKRSRLKEKARKAFNYFFDLDDDFNDSKK